jgi:hypothetical protein
MLVLSNTTKLENLETGKEAKSKKQTKTKLCYSTAIVYPLLQTHANLTHLRKKDKTGYFTFASAEHFFF